jgi:antitoxin (DNA-binding transcriptional repressor) of toxin-antitoxin stability system
MSVTEARASLPAVVDRVLAGDEVTLTRHGVAVAVIVRPDVLAVRRAASTMAVADLIGDALDAGRLLHLDSLPLIDSARADALVADVSQSRSRG